MLFYTNERAEDGKKYSEQVKKQNTQRKTFAHYVDNLI